MRSFHLSRAAAVLAATPILLPLTRTATAQETTSPPWKITVNVAKPGARLAPDFYGLMTEEINHAYDGGLYGELVRNRSFRDNANTPAFWSLVQQEGGAATMSLDKTGGVTPALNTSLKVSVATPGGRVGVANEGYWGIPVRPRTTYQASFYAKGGDGFAGPLRIGIESNDGQTTFAEAVVSGITSGWKKYTVTLHTKNGVTPSTTNRLVISTRQRGTFWLSFVSLFPPTYKNRPNGNRIDLMEKMAAMKPGFLRFPGGNYLDPGHYEWKKTIGPLEDRPLGRGAWGYPSSYGLGIMEFLLWCEELGMEPVLAVTDGRGWLPADGDVAPLVQDALDEIEYVTGPVTSPWGARRAADGHPAPFKLRYVEIGNEDFFDPLPVYEARFAKFYDAIRAKHPDLKIIATRGNVTVRRPDVVDDHIYASVPNMLRASHNYDPDRYDRKKPPIFVGEWATTVGSPTPIFKAALSDAAYLTGLERNADVVIMACYAPLFTNVNPGARQWGTNLIGYDALTSFGSPSYYMQAMFSQNKGDVVLPTTLKAPIIVTPPTASTSHGKVGVGNWNTQAEFRNAKVTEGTATLLDDALTTVPADKRDGNWSVQNGVLVQSGGGQPAVATFGDTKWTDYTYSVQARKTGGAEGFLIPFRYENQQNRIWWNLGGWGNTRSAFQAWADGSESEFGNTNTTIETGKWYDIRVEVKGRQVRGYLDGKLVVEAQEPVPTAVDPIYTSATSEAATGDIILKVVNAGDTPQVVQFDLQGAKRIAATAQGEMMVGQPDDVNTVAEPVKVAPKKMMLKGVGRAFQHTFPANSVSVFRLKTR